MHECCIWIGLAIIIPTLKAGCVPVVDFLAFQKTPEQFRILLVAAFPFSSAMDKHRIPVFTDLFQKLTDFLKILCPCILRYIKTLYVLLIQK